MDRRTNALPDQQTDQPTNQPTDTASYEGALSHLKVIKISSDLSKLSFLQNREIWDTVHCYCSLGLAPWAI